MIKTMMNMAVAAFALATGAQAQYYNFDITVHQEPSISELIAARQMNDQRDTLQFRNTWVYELDNNKRCFFVIAVPGLGAALAHGDWGAAWSFWDNWVTQQELYEKRYHRRSPAFIAANNAMYFRTHTRKHK